MHVGKPSQEEAQCKGRQVQGQDDHVQEVPPVQEVASQALDPHLLTLKPQEAWKERGRSPGRVRREGSHAPFLLLGHSQAATAGLLWEWRVETFNPSKCKVTFWKNKYPLLVVCVYMHECMGTGMHCHHTCAEVRGQLVRVGSFSPPYGARD